MVGVVVVVMKRVAEEGGKICSLHYSLHSIRVRIVINIIKSTADQFCAWYTVHPGHVCKTNIYLCNCMFACTIVLPYPKVPIKISQ